MYFFNLIWWFTETWICILRINIWHVHAYAWLGNQVVKDAKRWQSLDKQFGKLARNYIYPVRCPFIQTLLITDSIYANHCFTILAWYLLCSVLITTAFSFIPHYGCQYLTNKENSIHSNTSDSIRNSMGPKYSHVLIFSSKISKLNAISFRLSVYWSHQLTVWESFLNCMSFRVDSLNTGIWLGSQALWRDYKLFNCFNVKS